MLPLISNRLLSGRDGDGNATTDIGHAGSIRSCRAAGCGREIFLIVAYLGTRPQVPHRLDPAALYALVVAPPSWVVTSSCRLRVRAPSASCTSRSTCSRPTGLVWRGTPSYINHCPRKRPDAGPGPLGALVITVGILVILLARSSHRARRRRGEGGRGEGRRRHHGRSDTDNLRDRPEVDPGGYRARHRA